MSRGRIRRLAAQALASLPADLQERLDNVAITIAELPRRDDRAATGNGRASALFGIYHGWPLTERGHAYALVVPDAIVVFRRPLEALCRTRRQLATEIRRTVLHEVGHHFGLDDDALGRLERRA